MPSSFIPNLRRLANSKAFAEAWDSPCPHTRVLPCGILLSLVLNWRFLPTKLPRSSGGPGSMQGLLSLVLLVQASLRTIFALARAIGASTRFLCIRADRRRRRRNSRFLHPLGGRPCERTGVTGRRLRPLETDGHSSAAQADRSEQTSTHRRGVKASRT
jgi:hypothetical protein